MQHGATHVHPLALAFLACMCAIVLLSRKRSSATLAILLVCIFMPLDQRVVIAGLDFSLLRLISLAALTRIFVRGEQHGIVFGKLDRYFLFWVISASVFYVLRVGPSGIVYRLGTSFDALTAFFMIRAFVRGRADVFVVWRQVAWIMIVLCVCLIYEAVTRHNLFGMFRYGGWDVASVRDGSVRASGPFSHPILAGTFGAVSTPVLAAIYRGRKKQRKLFATSCVAATIVTLVSSSSGPAIAWAVGALGLWMWRYRKRMRTILWTLSGVAVVIHFIRERPIWHLIARVSSITGGTGYHRYKLIDAFVNHFTDWALVGTSNTAHWGWGLQDTTNQYVAEGVHGGLVTLILFVVLLRLSFVQLKHARDVFEHTEAPRSSWALLTWGTSVSLAAHCFSFISVSYFGQMQNFFFFFIAMIPALSSVKRPSRAKSPSARASQPSPALRPATSGPTTSASSVS